MKTRSPRFLLAVCATAAALAASGADGKWSHGLDLTVEGASSLAGAGEGGSALHSLALGHVQYEATAGERTHRFYASVLDLAGQGPSGKFLGDFLAASNIEGYQSVRLYSWWWETEAGGWSFRAGALLADEEFAGTDAGGAFCNSAFGWPTFISANTVNTGPAFFVAAPGVRLEKSWGEKAAWRLGLYDGDTFDSPDGDGSINRHGLHYQLGGAQGWFVISEADFATSGATRFTVGGWLHTARFADLTRDENGQPLAVTGGAPLLHRPNFGIYAAWEQTVAGEAGKPGNVESFLRIGGSPADRNAVAWSVDAGVNWTGLLPGRGEDVLAAGIAYAAISPDLRAYARAANPADPAPDFESVLEASYRWKLSDRFSLQPDLQYIMHPGASTAQRDALLLLVRLNASF